MTRKIVELGKSNILKKEKAELRYIIMIGKICK